jgi:wyosine [tRNA(Phe)-imidazoG37] synthetase (radical SAM superfamily)
MSSDIIYGPVASWRLGRSLGVDIICSRNICTYDCIYCQLGPSEEKTIIRRQFVEADKVIKALEEALPELKDETDIITVSGTGEPSLAVNIGEIIDGIHRVANFSVAVLTNGSLLFNKEVRSELKRAEIVVGSLDAGDPETWQKINRPHPKLDFYKMVEGMKIFSREYEELFALEVMVTSVNKDSVADIARLAADIAPYEVQINTPRRGSRVKALSPEEIDNISEKFTAQGLKIRSVYKSSLPEIHHLIGEKKLKHLKRPDK